LRIQPWSIQSLCNRAQLPANSGTMDFSYMQNLLSFRGMTETIGLMT
jgi:hypothetical protein